MQIPAHVAAHAVKPVGMGFTFIKTLAACDAHVP